MCKHPFIKSSDEPGMYQVVESVNEQQLIDMAKCLVSRRFRKGRHISAPKDTKDYLLIKMAEFDHEMFGMILLDNRHHIVAFDILFRGTIDGAAVYPREVVKLVLMHQASAVIFVHNHPSGDSNPSSADKRLTQRLAKALELIDVRVLDHFVVGGMDVVSFAEQGLL